MTWRLRLLSLMTVFVSVSPILKAQTMDLKEMDEIAEQRRQLNVREAQVKKRIRDLDVFKKYFGFLKQIQQDFLFGQDGVEKRFSAWELSMQSWLAKWSRLTTALADINESNLTLQTADFQIAYRDIVSELDKLVVESQEIRNIANKGLLTLNGQKSVPESLIAGYEDFIRASNTQKKNIRVTLETTLNQLSDHLFQELRTALNQLNHLMKTKVALLELQFPELKEQIRRSEQVLVFIELVDPMTVKLRSLAKDVNDSLFEGKVFTAQKLGQVLQVEANKAKKIIDQLPGDASLKANELAAIDDIVADTEQFLKRYEGNERYYFSSFVRREQRALSRDCKRAETAAMRNCELLRLINQIRLDRSSIDEMSLEDLAYLEAQLIKVKQGPSASLEVQDAQN